MTGFLHHVTPQVTTPVTADSVCDRKERVGVEEKRGINGFYLKAGRT